MASNNPTFELGFLDDFEDLQNVSELVTETSEASKDQQSYQWKEHVHMLMHVHKLCEALLCFLPKNKSFYF